MSIPGPRWFAERSQEASFVVFLFLGVSIFALGVGFFILGLSMNTQPPAPYMSGVDKGILLGGSIGTAILGGWIVRFAGRIVGW